MEIGDPYGFTLRRYSFQPLHSSMPQVLHPLPLQFRRPRPRNGRTRLECFPV